MNEAMNQELLAKMEEVYADVNRTLDAIGERILTIEERAALLDMFHERNARVAHQEQMLAKIHAKMDKDFESFRLKMRVTTILTWASFWISGFFFRGLFL
jgi:DNA-binding ferritin-like protein